ncbi:SGNH/GDSL hydrolase family protein [Stenotrophomonas lactitubi]|uniref:SGNH/GDSL hydrolase family protein n=1 Tax=Stenotrophomonas lactitubi TaxID=2045214 RepID=UPI001D9FAD43|nr:SGNH/GDSL hydrolase family protein [Stenotrophomonas lactitubi]CAH0173427.1 hypothetical protein SRABI81_01279 [Stenotrophomonas lactitubi]CAH0173753.1 hypothetical protein SRABI122_01247 [Stenotrophomonas lactitubi]CAH0191799.1 hypothetical protein SRABI102_01535 [Stenotrophomonas lactitubi]CAH0226303.1 hypothetical protein SRABI66_02574 [Stenotrophomonas lactitubi]
MTTFNTGNPLGSNSPKDLYDNAENLDAGINGPGHTWRDRRGQDRTSWAGIEFGYLKFLADGSTIEFPTWAAASAAAGAGQIPQNRQVAVIGDTGSHTDPVSGLTVPNSGRYVMVAAGLEWRSADVLTQKADRNPTRFGIASATRDADDALTQIAVTESMVTQVLHNATFAPVGNRAVYSASEAANGLPVNAYRFWMSNVPLLGDITLQVYSRVQAGSTSAYPPTANDTLLAEVTVNGADLANGNDFQYVEFRLPHAVTTTGTDLLVWKLSAAGGLSIGIRNDAPSLTQFRRGWFGNAGGASQNVGAPNRLAFEAFYREVDSALAPQINALESQASIIDRSFTREFSAAAARETNDQSYPQGAGHYAWTFGAQAGAGQDIGAGASIDTLALMVELASTVASLRLRVWSRPTDPATVGIYPASDGTATLLYSGIKTLAELGLEAVSGTWQDLRFPFPVIQAVDGQTYLFELWGYTAAAANVGIGITRAADGGLNQQQRGWYRGSSAIGVGSALAWRLGGDVFRIANDDPGDSSMHLLDAYDLQIDVSGLSVYVNGSGYGDGRKVSVNAALTVTAAATGTESKEDYSLIYDLDTVFPSIAGAWLGRRHISGVSAARSDTGTALTLGTDFAYHVNGKLRGLIDVAAFAVDVTYSYKRERYDLVQIDPQTQAVTIKAGPERDFDAVEYRPAPDEGRVVIGYLHVVGAMVTAINASKFQGGVVRRGGEADWQQLLMHNRACLRRLLGKAARGEAVKVASYGDSIVAVQLGDPPYTANSAARDRPENYLINMPADTVAALPKYDFGDGAGQVHVKISAVWPLIAALEQASGQPVEYLNFGRGGTTSGDTQHNGLWPARLQPVLESGADVLLLHFGMNELGQATTLTNIKSIASQAKAVGIEVVIMSVPRRNVVDGPALSGWNYTNRALWRAAVEAGAAFAPQHWIVMDEQLGGMGASPDSLGAAALFNHPGPAEFARYGQVLVESVLG